MPVKEAKFKGTDVGLNQNTYAQAAIFSVFRRLILDGLGTRVVNSQFLSIVLEVIFYFLIC